MSGIMVQGPDGKTVRFPDGTDPGKIDEVMSSIYTAKPVAAAKPAPGAHSYDSGDLIADKATFGFAPKAAAAVSALGGSLSDLIHGKSPDTSARYNATLSDLDKQKAAYVAAHPGMDWATLPANFIGTLGGAPEALAAKVGGGIARKAAVVGATYGAVSGAGNARGSMGHEAGQVALSSLLGAGGGAIAAKAVPYVAGKLQPVAQSAVTKISDLVGGNKGVVSNVSQAAAQNAPDPQPALTKIIGKTLAEQGMTPRQAGQVIADARAKGVPLGLMDTGDEMRGLASALARKPGESRTIMRDAVIGRQEGQTERVQGAIARDLGPVANVRTASEGMMQAAQAKAAPLYEKAYANPVPDSVELQTLAARPSMQNAMRRAYGIAKEEGRDPKVMGFNLDKEGNVTLEKHNSMQTWDYVKRGLDDVIESNRDPVTGRLKLDEAGRAVNATQRDFLGVIDKLNPDYAAARAAYAGPAKMTTALNKGAKIGTKDSETIQAETRDLSPAELDQYKLGVRSALSKMLEGKVDGADKVRALVGTPKKRAVLTQLFGGAKSFDNFMGTLAHEGATSATYGRVNTGSPTAANLGDDASLDGVGGIAAKAGVRAVSGHGVVENAIQTIADLARYGSGEAAKRLRSQLASGLSETDPVMLADLVRQASRANAGDRLRIRQANKAAPGTAARAGTLAGLGATALTNGGQ